MIKSEDGFSTPLALAVTFSLCLLIGSISLYVYTAQRKINSYKNKYTAEKEAEQLLQNFEQDLQTFVSCESDTFFNEEFISLLNKYSRNNVILKDLSTGLNINQLSEDFLNNINIKSLLGLYNEMITSDYGWINPNYTNKLVLSSITKDFDNTTPFPIVNTYSYYNLYSMNIDFITAIFKFYNISDAENAALNLYQKLPYTSFTKEDIAKELHINSNNKLFDLIGTKTTFWGVTLENDNSIINAVFAAIPLKGELNKLANYTLIDSTIIYKGGNVDENTI